LRIGAFFACSSAGAGFAADAGHGFDVGEKAAIAQGLAQVEGEPGPFLPSFLPSFFSSFLLLLYAREYASIPALSL
jgi:hypothetical protein